MRVVCFVWLRYSCCMCDGRSYSTCRALEPAPPPQCTLYVQLYLLAGPPEPPAIKCIGHCDMLQIGLAFYSLEACGRPAASFWFCYSLWGPFTVGNPIRIATPTARQLVRFTPTRHDCFGVWSLVRDCLVAGSGTYSCTAVRPYSCRATASLYCTQILCRDSCTV